MCGHGSLESDWLVRGEVDIAQAVDRSGNANGDASDQHARGGKDVRGHFSSLQAVGWLRPIPLPIVRAEVLAAHYAICCALNLDAAGNRNGPLSARPLAYGWLFDSKLCSQFFLASDSLNGFVDCIHAHKYRHCRCLTQVYCL